MLFLYLMSANSNETKVETVSGTFVCESCGESFSCGSNVDQCWCFDVETDEETLTKLRRNFKNCLCGKCLKKYNETTSRT